ncbi:hypothetical protein PHYPSEUDO_014448 [Phytophthora pseudosyringae]|uniref:Uncharacterized protein n=1 Tax=Phytophthora pseudosyringae TaxID=221518 RepID=A0A8T1V7P7_9STRA|nr:hypothetical protein PHYPSEUDO_014448 [Phytophthora pseudosyringae]
MVKAKTATDATSSGSKGVKVKPTIHVVTVTAPRTRQSQAREASAENQAPPTSKLTPYERLRDMLASTASGIRRRVISTVKELQAHRKDQNGHRPEVTLCMKLLWASDHTYREFRLIRLHFVDADSPEPTQDLIMLFLEHYDTIRDAVNSLLLTATI